MFFAAELSSGEALRDISPCGLHWGMCWIELRVYAFHRSCKVNAPCIIQEGSVYLYRSLTAGNECIVSVVCAAHIFECRTNLNCLAKSTRYRMHYQVYQELGYVKQWCTIIFHIN